MSYHSQFGEDKWLVENMNLPEKGFFLDLGAGDPVRLSNTYHFEQKGWEGICVEGDPRNFTDLIQERKTVVFGLLNTKGGLVDFNISDHGADLSSIKYDTEAKKVVFDCFTMWDLFAKFTIPKQIDLLSIDLEGIEIPILQELFIYRKPKIIICEYDETDNDVESFMKNEQYQLMHKNQANLIYKRT